MPILLRVDLDLLLPQQLIMLICTSKMSEQKDLAEAPSSLVKNISKTRDAKLAAYPQCLFL